MSEKEYIERETLLDRIRGTGYAEPIKSNLLVMAVTIPAADVRPVVLCRDCKWTKTDGMDDPAIYCMQWDRWEVPPDGFCWLGEKRGEQDV